jgi:hypothetical protein
MDKRVLHSSAYTQSRCAGFLRSFQRFLGLHQIYIRGNETRLNYLLPNSILSGRNQLKRYALNIFGFYAVDTFVR